MNIIIKIISVLLLLVLLSAVYFYFQFKPAQKIEWGVTFSHHEARGLGFDDRTMYLDILNDLNPKKVRLMTYWEDIERTKGKFDFSVIDWQLNEAQKRNIGVLLVVGRKQPRWPECHQPDWFGGLTAADQDQAVLDFIKATVEHVKASPVIKQWQVENEPYFIFGVNCPAISKDLFTKEVALLRSLDDRPIVATDSGDRGGWIPVGRSGADIVGVTLYRLSYDEKYGGYYRYPIPAAYYRVRAGILASLTNIKEVWNVELQMEPWFINGAFNTPLEIQNSLMNPKVFNENIEYAKKIGFAENYLWGVEWWYWMAKKNNDWGMWATAKDLFAKSR